ncbi:MAG TPA: hypothetical protein VNZ50_03615 [Hyphomicrobiaceae bacterium]|nr:hypothetical protein [Hyphomicrobiaceae bacterium]
MRVVAQAMALVFALVSVWGSLAHACHGSPHGTAQETAIHHAPEHGVATDAQVDHVPGHVSHKGTHPCCADLQCHAGVAIMTAGLVTVVPHSAAESFTISDQTHEDAHLASLDRPPRPSVQV